MKKVSIVTDHPIAYESHDHVVPKGTANDNSKNDNFIKAIIDHMGQNISYADWGCAGGGFVKQFYDAGVDLAVGVEGSDHSKKHKRAEWNSIPDNLFTANIIKPFHLVDENNEKVIFDVISCFDVLEHIHEEDLPGLIQNIKSQLRKDGYFIASIAEFEDKDYHVTLKPSDWWCDLFKQYGLYDWGLLTFEQFGRTSTYNIVFKNVDVIE